MIKNYHVFIIQMLLALVYTSSQARAKATLRSVLEHHLSYSHAPNCSSSYLLVVKEKLQLTLGWSKRCQKNENLVERKKIDVYQAFVSVCPQTSFGLDSDVQSPSPRIFWITHANFHSMGYGNNLNMINISFSLYIYIGPSQSELFPYGPMGHGSRYGARFCEHRISLSE